MVDSKEKAKAPKAEKPVKAEAKPKTEKIVSTESTSSSAKLKKADAKKTAVIEASAAAKADAWTIIKSSYLTEKSTRMIESQNKLVFIVKERATKTEIKQAVEAAFSVKVAAVNTTSTMRGEKKAYVRLKPEFKALDIATKLGMM